MLLDLTEPEVAKIETAVRSERSQMQDIELKLATAEMNQTSGELVISVPPYPAEGARLYDELTREVRSVLGAERYAWVEEQGGIQGFQNLGLERREIGIVRKTGKESACYEVRTERQLIVIDPKTGQMENMQKAWSSGQTTNRAGLLQQFGPLVEKFLPELPMEQPERG